MACVVDNIGPANKVSCDDSSSRFEPQHDTTNKMSVRPAKTQPSLLRVFTVRMMKPWVLSYPWAHSEGCDQTGWMPRLIWVFVGRTLTLLVLSWCGSFGHCVLQHVIWAGASTQSGQSSMCSFWVVEALKLLKWTAKTGQTQAILLVLSCYSTVVVCSKKVLPVKIKAFCSLSICSWKDLVL